MTTRRLGAPGARSRRDARTEDGMTLLELIVAMAIFGIVLTMVIGVFVSTIRSFADQQAAVDNSRLASTSMNEVTRVIRAGTEIPMPAPTENAPVFEYAGAEKVVVHSFIDAGSSADPAPIKVQFGRNGANELLETRVTATLDSKGFWKFGNVSGSSRTIARSLLPASTGAPLFRYFDGEGTALTPPSGGSLTAADIRNVASVQVSMRVQGDASGRVAPVEIRNLVGLPNLGVSRVEVAG